MERLRSAMVSISFALQTERCTKDRRPVDQKDRSGRHPRRAPRVRAIICPDTRMSEPGCGPAGPSDTLGLAWLRKPAAPRP